MSMNYYFVPNESESLDNNKNKTIETAFEEMKQKLVSVGFPTDEVEEVLSSIRHTFHIEPTSIHIGKRSLGWQPLFHAHEHFYSTETLEQWYLQHKDLYRIENEYGELLTWQDLKEQLFQWYGKSHLLTRQSSFYYKDDTGQEWTYNDFS